MAETITQPIKDKITELMYQKEDGEFYISLGNCRLDFSKEYKVIGFTNKTLKLAWLNGREWVPTHARIEYRNDYYALYAEGWSYIEHLKMEQVIQNETN